MTESGPQPLFVVFEGIDGAGTTTQVEKLVARLSAAGCEYVQTREPGGTAFGEQVREVVLDPRYGDVDPVAELFLIAGARRQHAHELIEPALKRGKPVICDRYAASTAAYQGGGRQLERELVQKVNAAAVGACWPDLNVLLDVAVVEAEERRAGRALQADRLERAGSSFQERVRAEFLVLAAADPERWWVVNGGGAADEVAEAVYAELRRRWPRFPYR